MERLSGKKRSFTPLSPQIFGSQPSKRFKKTYVSKSKRTPTAVTKITKIKQISNLGYVSNAATTDTFAIIKFNLDDIPGYADLATVFDQYKIDKIVLKFISQGTNSTLLSGGASQLRGIIYTVFDENDATPFTTLNEAIQYQNCTFNAQGEDFYRTIYPRLDVNSSDANGTISLAQGSWCNTSEKDVTWYGLKLALAQSGNSAGTIQRWQVMATYYMSFKNIK